MPEDDPLRAILAKHLDRDPVDDRGAFPGIDPITMARVCDLALTTLSSVAHLVAVAEAALLLQRQRLVQGAPSAPGNSASQSEGPTRIPIHFEEPGLASEGARPRPYPRDMAAKGTPWE